MIQLSDHFNYKRLLRFTFPSIVMLVFTSIYGVVDGFFVSNYAGKTPFAAVNFIFPVLMILGCAGFMFGTGGSALIAKTLGEGAKEKANGVFSLLVYAAAACGAVLAAAGFALMPAIAAGLGAQGQLLEDSVRYGRIIVLALPFYILQSEFQCLFVTAEKPKLGLAVTVAAGSVNMALDALFIAGFKWGVAGAALATGISQCVGGILPFFYFLRPNRSLLRLVRTGFEADIVLKACGNGSSELMSNISGSLVSIVYNFQLLRFSGENGVAAYGVLMYVQFIFVAMFIGYTIGTGPVVGYHYGAGNHGELKSLLKKSYLLMGTAGIVMMLLSRGLAHPLAAVFVGYDAELLAMTVHAFRLFSFSFILAGLNIFTSAFFTALSNGGISAAISFLRTLVFQLLSVLLLPLLLGLDGICWAITVAEVFAFIISLGFLAAKREKYHYL